MDLRYDIAIKENKLFIRDVDFVIAQSDQQHIIDTTAAFPGWWKEHPLDGVGILKYEQSPSTLPEISRKIRIELQSDEYIVNNPIVTIENGLLTVDPNIQIL